MSLFPSSEHLCSYSIVLPVKSIKSGFPYLVMVMLYPDSDMGQLVGQDLRLLMYRIIRINEDLGDATVIREVGYAVRFFVDLIVCGTPHHISHCLPG